MEKLFMVYGLAEKAAQVVEVLDLIGHPSTGVCAAGPDMVVTGTALAYLTGAELPNGRIRAVTLAGRKYLVSDMSGWLVERGLRALHDALSETARILIRTTGLGFSVTARRSASTTYVELEAPDAGYVCQVDHGYDGGLRDELRIHVTELPEDEAALSKIIWTGSTADLSEEPKKLVEYLVTRIGEVGYWGGTDDEVAVPYCDSDDPDCDLCTSRVTECARCHRELERVPAVGWVHRRGWARGLSADAAVCCGAVGSFSGGA